MRTFNYSAIRQQKWDSDVLGLIAAIYKEAGKQELYLKQRPEELEKLVEIAKIQSTEASNAIEGIVTTSTRIRQLVEEKTTPRNRDEQEIVGYRDVLSTRKQRLSSARASASAPKSWRRSKRSSAAFRRTSCGRRCALPTGWIIGTKRTASRTSAPRRSPATKIASACTSSRSWAKFR